MHDSGEMQYSLQDIFELLAGTRTFEDVLDRILEITTRELAADQGSLLLLHTKDASSLQMLASRGLPPEIVRRGYVPRKGSISEYVIREQRPVIINDELRTTDFETMSASTSTPRRIYSAVCVPLVARGKLLGTLNLNRTTENRQFKQSELEAATIIAGQAAFVIRNSQLQEELVQQQRLAAVGQTVAGISHCIKNILSGVCGGMGLTEMGLDKQDLPLMREGFTLLKRNTTSLSNLVLDLLDYSKERVPIREEFEVRTMIENVISTVEFKAKVGKIELLSQVEDATCFGDQDQLFRAVLNIAGNAVDACIETPRSGVLPRVLVKTELWKVGGKDDQLLIEIIDNGPGISADVQDEIWNLFYSTKGSRGTGIGLPVSRKMIEEHGGSIQLISSAEIGTTFRIFLPITNSPE